MKRKYPISFFIMGFLQSLIRYFFIGLIGIVLWFISLFGFEIIKVIGIIIMISYVLLCLIEQIFIRSNSLKESDNPEVNELFDHAFGVDRKDEDNKSPQQRIIDHVNDIISAQTEKGDENDFD